MAQYLSLFQCLLVIMLRCSQGCPIVEQGQPATIECTFPNTRTNVTWQYVEQSKPVPIVTCDFASTVCSDTLPDEYHGTTEMSGSDWKTSLTIKNTKKSQTQFQCVANNFYSGKACALEVYVWPLKPVCTQNVKDTYVEIKCITDNVYPNFNAVLYRREFNLTDADYSHGYPKDCHLGLPSSGSNKDYTGSCTWRIAITRMLYNSSFYVEMTATVTNQSAVNNPPARSDDLIITLDVPEGVIDPLKCPVGPTVLGPAILAGTNASCTCELSSHTFEGVSARWFTKDNKVVRTENTKDGYSILTVSYDAQDPNPSFTCRPATDVMTNAPGKTFTPIFTTKNCSYSVERGKSVVLECIIPNNVSSVTWQSNNGTNQVNLTTCSFSDNKCTGSVSGNLTYEGSITNSSDIRKTQLNLTTDASQTKFSCLTDDGTTIDTCAVEVYELPSKPTCYVNVLELYVDYICTTDNVYPSVHAVLHRVEEEFTQEDFEEGYPHCTLRIGSNGGNSETCVWCLPMESMFAVNTLYVQMTPKLSNMSHIDNATVIGDEMAINFPVPYVELENNTCDRAVQKGKVATCVCDVHNNGLTYAYVKWVDKNNETVANYGLFIVRSVLFVSYDPKDPNQTYHCWPVTPLRTEVKPIAYSPIFLSSAAHTVSMELDSLIMVLGGVLMVISRIQLT